VEWTQQKQRFEPLSRYVSMPTDKKEAIRAALHAEVERIEQRQQRRWWQRRAVTVTSLSTAAVVAAASVVVVLQLSDGHKVGPDIAKSSVAAGTSHTSQQQQGMSSAATQGSSSQSASTSSTRMGPVSAAKNLAEVPSRTLTPDNPIAMFGQVGWLLTKSGLAHTSDGGQQWQAVTLPDSQQSASASASPSANKVNHVVAVVNGAEVRVAAGHIDNGVGQITVSRTEDAGATWVSVSVKGSLSADQAGQIPSSLNFAGAKDGWMTTASLQPGMGGTQPGGLYRTTNGGQTWARVGTSFANNVVPFAWIAFANANVGFTEAAPQANADAGVTTGQYRLYRTSDGGSNWTAVSLQVPRAKRVDWQPPQWAGTDGYTLASLQTGSAAQELLLYRTSDDGRSWTQTHQFSAGPGNGIAMSVTPAAVWVYWNGVLWKSTDAGKQFNRVPANIGPISGLDMTDALRGTAVVTKPVPGTVGQTHTLYRTTDGGQTWTKLSVQP